MALALFDRVQETTTTTGTGAVTLDGAVPGYQSFAVVGNTNTCYYTIVDGVAWEVGVGTYSTSGPTLARTTVLSNSNGNTSPITLAVGTKIVFLTYPASKSVNLNESGNVSPLGTVVSGIWNGTTIGVAYGGTGVTTSSGANSVVLRDSNQNVAVNRVNQANTNTTAAGGTTALTAASSYIHTLVGTGGQTYTLPDATTLTTGVAFVFNNLATSTLTVANYAGTTIGTIPSGGAGAVFLTLNSTVGGTWDLHAYLPEGVTFGTNAFNLGTSIISGGTWQGGTIATGYGGTGLTSYTSGGAVYANSSSTLTSGTLPVTAGGTGATTAAGAQSSLNVPSTTGSGASGTWGISITGSASGSSGSVANAATFNSGGAGDASGTTFNGAAARTISYNTIGAPSTTGTNASGTWGISISGNSATTSQRAFSGDISTTGQGRFTGWYTGNAATGPATEVGLAGGEGYILSYNRSTSAYVPLNIAASAANMQFSGSTINVTSGALQQGGNQVLHAGNYNSYAPTLTGGGASGTWAINITGSAGSAPGYLPLSGGTLTGNLVLATGANRYVQIGSATSYYYRLQSTNDNFEIQEVTTPRLTISYPTGAVTASTDFRAPIFYDSNNTAYYLDPTSNSVLTTAIFYVNGSSALTLTSAGTNAAFIKADGGDELYIGGNNTWQMRFSGANVLMDNGGYFLNGESIRAPIFYDSNNTAYYVDPTSTSLLNSINVYGGGLYDSQTGFRLTLPGGAAYATGASTVNGAIKVRLPPVSLGSNTMMGFDVDVYTYDSQSFTIRCGGYNYSDGGKTWYNVFAYMLSGNRAALNVRFGWDGTSQCIWIGELGSSWSYPQVGVSNFVGGYSGFNAANFASGWTVSFETSSFYSVSNSVTVYPFPYYSGQSATLYSSDSMRSPIFYDLNNTAYYLDAAGTSRISNINYDNLYFAGDTTYGLIGRNGYLDTVNGRGSDPLELNYYDGGPVKIGSGTNGSKALYASELYSTIFYDSADTSYYLNPNASSSLYGMVLSGSMYFRPQSWVQFDGSYGIYWPNNYGAHLYANTGSTYTQIRLDGQKNGYDGMWLSYSAVNGMMYDSSGNGGVYREANGRWYWYHHVGNNCMGVGTASTSSSYGIYVIKGVYSEGNVVAYSDERVKTNWRDYPADFVEQLAKVKHGTYDRTDIELTQDGVSAQSLQKLLPYSAPEDENKNLAVNYGGAAMVSAVELAKYVTALEQRIAQLEARL